MITSDESSKLTIKAKTINIPIDAQGLSIYPIASVFNKKQGEDLFYGYNYFSNSIDVYDIKNRVFSHKITFDNDGPEYLTDLETFEVVGLDSFLIKASKRLLIKGKNTHEIMRFDDRSKLKSLGSLELDKIDVMCSLFDGITFYDKNIYFPIINNDHYPNLFIDINLKDRSCQLVDISIPLSFKGKFYGDKMYPNMIAYKEDLIYTFEFSNKVFLFNPFNRKKEIIPVTSDFTKNESPEISKDDFEEISLRVKYHMNEIHFYGVQYDQYRNLFYRVHMDKRESSDEKAKFYLTILNEQFKKLHEFQLPENIKPFFEVGEAGIYFPLQTKNESTLSFYLLEFE
jgi:hypothetical protein